MNIMTDGGGNLWPRVLCRARVQSQEDRSGGETMTLPGGWGWGMQLHILTTGAFQWTLKTGKLKLQKENTPTGNTSVSQILQERSREVLDGFDFEKGIFCKTAMKTLLCTDRSHDTLLSSAADVFEAFLLHYVRINMNCLTVCIAWRDLKRLHW